MGQFELPILTSTLFILETFVVALVVFHFSLVKWASLSEITWKKIDYVWLSFALLGILASVGSVRQYIAINMLSTATSTQEYWAKQVEERIAFGQGPVVCRKFIRSEFSPPPEVFEQRQKEFDEQCAWFTNASKRLWNTPFSRGGSLHIEDLGTPLPTGGVDWALSTLKDAIQRYDEAVMQTKKLKEESRRSSAELILAVIGPFLVTIALALRITKATGEIKLEKAKNYTTLS